jgi:DNA helicase INO80
MSQRKSSRKGKEARPPSPVPTNSKKSQGSDEPPNDDTLLASSDLEDCREVWIGELGDYVLETKKRQNQVAQYFWSTILVNNL